MCPAPPIHLDFSQKELGARLEGTRSMKFSLHGPDRVFVPSTQNP